MAECKLATIQLPNSSYIYDSLAEFFREYGHVHGYLCLALCLFGIFANSLNVTVLTRSALRTPVNAILCLIAICNLVVTMMYTVYLVKIFFIPKRCIPSDFSYAWAVYVLVHAHMTFIGHSSSMWLGVLLALMRYIVLRQKSSRRGLTPLAYRKSVLQGLIVMAFITVVNTPLLLSFKVVKAPMLSIMHSKCVPDNDTEELYGYITGLTDLATSNDCLLLGMVFWESGMIFKIVPCLILAVLICLLVAILSNLKKRRLTLHRSSYRRRRDRTTTMLVVILLVSFITEIPQGLLATGASLFSEEFRVHVYQNLGDFMDLLSLINSDLNFVIYCAMSKQYRKEFGALFVPASVKAWLNWQRTDPNVMETPVMRTKKMELNSATCDNSEDYLARDGEDKLLRQKSQRKSLMLMVPVVGIRGFLRKSATSV